jgi:pSer/pThr/pTyr-binding forkhead associated (FHA) protein
LAGGGAFLVVQGRSAGRLVFETGPRSGQTVVLRSGKLRIGALDENDLVLNLPEISRYHAQVYVRGGHVEVEDLGSKNGTFINGTPIRARSEIAPGDRLRVGNVELIYRK